MAQTIQNIEITESKLPIAIIVNQFVGKIKVTNDNNIIHVEHENYYLYYFVFGFQHFSFAFQIIKCVFKSGKFSRTFAS